MCNNVKVVVEVSASFTFILVRKAYLNPAMFCIRALFMLISQDEWETAFLLVWKLA